MKIVVRSFISCLLALTFFTFFSCNPMTNGNGKSNYSKDDSALIDRLNAFGINIKPILEEEEKNTSTWKPLEGNYEIPVLSGKNVDYSENIPSAASSRSAYGSDDSNSLSGLSSFLFSRMKMTELYVCGSGTG